MKKSLILLLLSLTLVSFRINVPESFLEANIVKLENIDNGWYTAKVKYYNSKTYHNATYTLDVKVDYNTVTTIDFGDGGSIHSGYNNSGYLYGGGYLFMERDYNGNVIAATTKVTVSFNDGSLRTYDIRIE